MDKLNYRIKWYEKQGVRSKFRKLFKEVEKGLERQKLIKRKRVIQNYTTLLRAVYLYLADQLSFQRLSDEMASLYKVVLSDTAWRKHFIKLTPVLFSVMLNDVVAQSKQWHYCKRRNILSRFQTYLLDATRFSVQGGTTTAVQVHTQISLTDLSDLFMLITNHHTAESVKNFKLQKGALYLADRAYGRATQLAYLIQHGSAFIIRISPTQIALYKDKECKNKIDWKQILTKSSFSISCYIRLLDQKDMKSFHIRLVGRLLPPDKHPAIEKRIRQKSSKRQNILKGSSLEYSKWVLLATSLFEVKNCDILNFYRLRWQIELFFKKTKSLLHFHKLPRSSSLFQSALVSLWLFFVLLLSQISFSCTPSPFSNFNTFSLALAHLRSFFA